MDIAERIRCVRGELSQDEFAKRLDVHKNSLGRYERRASIPDVEFAEKICIIFGVNPEWLLLGKGSMRGEENTPTSSREAELEAQVAELEKETKRLEQDVEHHKNVVNGLLNQMQQVLAIKAPLATTDAPESVPSAPLTDHASE